jgi:phosphatidylethanolamine/phosphatidyl-N-methylethanolamine N-methyltransferase
MRYPTAERVEAEERRVERVYSVLARVYDDFFDWALEPGRRRAVARLPVRPGDEILEIGVGTGLSLPLYPRHCRVTGIDISEPMLEQARARLRELDRDDVSLRRMDARRLHFADASFDHVIAPYVISVVPEPEKVMLEIARVCRPGGTVTVVNHFGSCLSIVRRFEGWLSHLTGWVGFRLDVPVEVVTTAPGLELVHEERVNLFGLWKLVELRRV